MVNLDDRDNENGRVRAAAVAMAVFIVIEKWNINKIFIFRARKIVSAL